MLGRIIEWSVRNVFLVLLSTLFVVAAGVYAVIRTPLDAIPDLSDVQVIIYTEYPGQAPQVVEDQITYPLSTAMLAVPKSKVVRGLSVFGASFIYVIFEDGTDIYWARTRVLEYLNFASGRMPRGVTPTLGPDATGVGWVYQYAVLAANRSLAELRTIQDWFVRYQLTKAQGVAEVASVGGFVKTYQVTVEPRKLQAYGIPLMKVVEVIRASNRDVGGRAIEMAETEFVVRGRGYLRGVSDIENLVVKADKGTPVLIRDIARVELVPDERRGLTELNGEGEVVAGIAVARYGQNALDVIRNLKAKIAEISSGLPQGVSLQTVYDRSDLIHRAIDNLKRTLIEESVIVALVCIVFLMHARSALVAIVMLPIGVLMAMIAMHLMGTQLQHHEPGRHRHRHRRHGGCGHRHDRERAQASGARAAGRAAPADHDRRLPRSRAGAVFQPADHHRLLPAGVHARSPGRPDVHAARLHQDFFHGRRRAAVDHPGAGADVVVHPRQDHAGEEKPD